MATGVETFTAADGSALPSPWVTKADYGGSINGVIDIQSNRVRITHPNVAYYGVTAVFGNAADLDVTMTVTLQNPKVEQYACIAYRMQAGISDQGNEWNLYGQPWDGFQWTLEPTNNVSRLIRLDDGGETVLATVAFTFTAATTYKLRVRVIAGSHKMAVWDASGVQSGWQAVVHDATYETNTVYGFANSGNSSLGQLYIDDFTWDDAPVPTPGEYLQGLGTAVSNSNGTTLAISFTGGRKPAVGDLVCFYCARDNVTNDPGTGDSMSDGEGNTYTSVVLAQPAGTSTAAAGIVGVMFYTVVTATWTGTNTLTWTLPSRVGKVMRADHFQGPFAGLRGTADTAGATAGTVTVLTTDPLAGDLVCGMSAYEHSTASTVTADSDTTNGAWSTQPTQLASGGTTLAAVKVVSQFKLVTAPGNQSYATTNSTTASVDTVGIVATFIPSYPLRARQPSAPRGGVINGNFY